MLNKWYAKWSCARILRKQVSCRTCLIGRAAKSTVNWPEPRLLQDQPIAQGSFPIILCFLSEVASGKVSYAVSIVLVWQVNYELSCALSTMQSRRLQIDLSGRLSLET